MPPAALGFLPVPDGPGGAGRPHRGPAAAAVVGTDGRTRFTAARDIPAGAEVTWSYGRLTNEDMLVPPPPPPTPTPLAHPFSVL
jgi:hypothetical protein